MYNKINTVITHYCIHLSLVNEIIFHIKIGSIQIRCPRSLSHAGFGKNRKNYTC